MNNAFRIALRQLKNDTSTSHYSSVREVLYQAFKNQMLMENKTLEEAFNDTFKVAEKDGKTKFIYR